MVKKIIIIDPGVKDYKDVVKFLPEGTEVVILEGHRDGMAQIVEILQD